MLLKYNYLFLLKHENKYRHNELETKEIVYLCE